MHFIAEADLINYAKGLDADPLALLCHDMHITSDAQKESAGKAIQQIYGGDFQTALWKVIKVIFICCLQILNNDIVV